MPVCGERLIADVDEVLILAEGFDGVRLRDAGAQLNRAQQLLQNLHVERIEILPARPDLGDQMGGRGGHGLAVQALVERMLPEKRHADDEVPLQLRLDFALLRREVCPDVFGQPLEALLHAGQVAGLLKNDPFSDNGLTNGRITLISSSDTFVRLTGEENYALIMVQTASGATDEDVQAIQTAVGETFNFQDMRDGHTSGTYTAFVFCVYAFLSIIALVTVLNIVNSISMSVSARMKQYGAMRAVGMDERQVTKMIAAEAATYAVLGCAVGCIIGLPLSKLLYDFLIAEHFPYAVWHFPLGSLFIILLFVFLAAAAAIHAPAKRIRSMPITATINDEAGHGE